MRPVAFALPLILAACQPAAPDPRGVDRDETLLTVSATGRSEARPDEATFIAGVESLAGSAAEATRLNNEKMARVSVALAKFGVGQDDLQTQNLSLGRVDYGPDRGKYKASNNLTVRMRQMERVGEAVAATTDAGANLISGPSLRVSDREAASRSAYAMAYKAARARAEAYAGAAGLKIDRILAIRDGGASQGEPIPLAEQAMSVQMAAPVVAPAPPPPPFNPGVNVSHVSVRVDFALKR
ncbi:SIMPL domain-containing protein [Sphingomonas rhizophila]|uniref:SIMPL domain-containing protein n=1 Tax=Sphingomonas rhizophila TaxID=2071607 RepID=A0A7G9SA31_9SPHN|nr:SIMPL domain-containing protein [Sphingomonas rhizophila]QNN64706.1 SIMPL domain-containing protein [Sphingomonas rhizophila]